MCLAEHTRYYSSRYSNTCYGISVFLRARYKVSTLIPQSHCDGCGTVFVVTHELSYSIGGLVITCHNKIRNKLLYLSRRAFTSASVRAEPLTNQGRTRSKKEIRQGSGKDKKTQEDVMVQGL